jgi:phage/plasmid-associated DNA primase
MFQMPLNFAYTKASFEYGTTEVIPLFLEIVGLITSEDPILTDYVLNWTAHLVQKPTDLPGVALVLTGSKGVGKDTFGDFLQEFVVGRYLSTNYTTNKQFFGTHDTGKLNKFLIKLEETSKKDCFENSSELKASITAVQVTANPKGIKEITADNFARFIFTTNKANPVDMSDEERRFVLLKCSACRKGDHAFWKKVREVLFNPSAGAEVAHYLLKRDISDFQVRKLPENQYQHSIVKSEETSEQKFIAQWDGEKTNADTLYDLYKDYCLTKSIPYANNASWFGRNLQSLVRDCVINHISSSGVSYYEKHKRSGGG